MTVSLVCWGCLSVRSDHAFLCTLTSLPQTTQSSPFTKPIIVTSFVTRLVSTNPSQFTILSSKERYIIRIVFSFSRMLSLHGPWMIRLSTSSTHASSSIKSISSPTCRTMYSSYRTSSASFPTRTLAHPFPSTGLRRLGRELSPT